MGTTNKVITQNQSKAQLKQGLLKYPIDIFSLWVVAGVLVLSFLPFVTQLEGWALALIIVLLAFFKPIASLVQHNHVHYAIFNSKSLNFIFNQLLSLSTGHLCSEWLLHHNIGHHGNPINSLADTSSVRHPKTREYLSTWGYIWRGSLKIYPDCCRMAWDYFQKGKKQYLHTLLFESLFLFSVYALLLWLNPLMTLFFFLIANMISRALVWLGAYWHHLDVPATHLYDSANMCQGPVFNFISFNIGYHVAHHEQPSLHWSRLKARTAEIRHKIADSQIVDKVPWSP